MSQLGDASFYYDLSNNAFQEADYLKRQRQVENAQIGAQHQSNILSGALGGAALGAHFGPVGAGVGAVAGLIFGGLF